MEFTESVYHRSCLVRLHDGEFQEPILQQQQRCLHSILDLGDDADSTGAACGQLAGESGIPDHLLGGVARRDMIEGALQQLL